MRQITIVIHRETDGWWAEAPELPGFSAAAATIDSLREVTRDGLAFHLDDEPFAIFELTVDHTPRSMWTEFVTTSVGAAQGAAKAFAASFYMVSNQPVRNQVAASVSPAPVTL